MNIIARSLAGAGEQAYVQSLNQALRLDVLIWYLGQNSLK